MLLSTTSMHRCLDLRIMADLSRVKEGAVFSRLTGRLELLKGLALLEGRIYLDELGLEDAQLVNRDGHLNLKRHR